MVLLVAGVTASAGAAHAQTATPAPAERVPVTGGVVRSIAVTGAQRLEPDTVRSYIKLRAGGRYTVEALDQAIRDLYETELFADATIRDDNGNLTIAIRENPVINRIILEGNKRQKDDKITKEIKIAPRQIFTQSKVRADVNRIIELYRRQGRFAAGVEPKMVLLDQNRVDVVFEISEGPKSKVRQINIIGNEKFSDKKLRSEMATRQARFSSFLSSKTSYDPDKLAFDQSKMRQFYLTNGFADFRVVSAVAELTPNKRDFIITYVVEEGERYKFGEVAVESEIRDFKPTTALVPFKKGDWYDAKKVEDTVESLTESAGLFGYAFAEVNPKFDRDKDAQTMTLTFSVADAPRVYVERIDINGNTVTQDRVVRREFRLAEGDAFNSFQVKRSSDRIQSLGFFQEKLEIEQKPGSAPDRIVLEANVEEKPTGELQLSAGFSSLERFILSFSIRQRNFRGRGQELRAGVNISSFSKSVELGFTEPYLGDRNIAIGADVFRRDTNSFNFQGNRRETSFEQITTGAQVRIGLPITEFWSLAARYGLSYDEIFLDRSTFFTAGACDPLRAGRFLCDQIGNRLTSSIGYSLVFDNLNNRIRPSAGQKFILSQDLAGLGGATKYLQTRAEVSKYWRVLGSFIFSLSAEGGHIISFEKRRGPGIDKVRINNRFFLGEPELRGFDIRGVGPRVIRQPYITGTATLDPNPRNIFDDALGGRYYYKGRAELEIPLGSGARELGLRPSIFMDVGAVFGVTKPILTGRANAFMDRNGDGIPDSPLVQDAAGNLLFTTPTDASVPDPLQRGVTTTCSMGFSPTPGGTCVGTFTNSSQVSAIPPFEEFFLGNTPKPRLSVGFGVNWNSPFGPFRIDIARALLKSRGDDTKLITFNVGTQF